MTARTHNTDLPCCQCLGESVIYCLLCASDREKEFTAEISMHFSELKNLGESGVLVFPRLLVCLDCGFSWFTAPEAALALLARANPTWRESTLRRDC